MNGKTGFNGTKMQSLRASMIGKFITQFVKEMIDPEAGQFGAHRPGFQLIDVEQGVEHPRHGGGRLVETRDERQRFFLLVIADLSRQNAAHEAERLQWLPKIMACCSKKPGFC